MRLAAAGRGASAVFSRGIGEEAEIDRSLVGGLLEIRTLAIPNRAGALELRFADLAGIVPDLLVVGDLALYRRRIEVAEILRAQPGEDLVDRCLLEPLQRAIDGVDVGLRLRLLGDRRVERIDR